MYYNIRHVTRFAYESPVSETLMEVRKHPRTEQNQRCLSFSLHVAPKARVFSYRDYLGNVVHHFDVPGRFAGLTVTAESVVELDPPPTPMMLTSDAWDELDAMVNHGDYWEFLTPSQYARPSQQLNEFKQALHIERGYDPLTTVLSIKEKIFHHFEYDRASTSVDSPIEDALRTRKGVCQDFAHIMIALTRELKIPCRYVSGYLFHNRHKDRSAEGATHAWVEVLVPRTGWVGFDPTNKLVACERHVRTAIGRDYADVPPTRGLFKGESKSHLSVHVKVHQSEHPFSEANGDSPMDQWAPRTEAEATLADNGSNIYGHHHQHQMHHRHQQQQEQEQQQQQQ